MSTPGVIRGLGSVVFPGGTSALPGVQRTFGSVVHPGGGGAQIGIPGLYPVQPVGVHNNFGGHRGGGGSSYIVGYPIYVGGYSGMGDYYDPSTPGYPQVQAPPNITVIYPPAPAPVIVSPYSSGETAQFMGPQQPMVQQQPQAPPEETQHYLIPFKDHTIYSAVAYWVNGDTLHYVTAGNTHNQVSLTLVDRDLMQRLNTQPASTPIR